MEWINVEADANDATLNVALEERGEVDEKVCFLMPHRSSVGQGTQVIVQNLREVVICEENVAELLQPALLVRIEADEVALGQVVVTVDARDPPSVRQLASVALVFALASIQASFGHIVAAPSHSARHSRLLSQHHFGRVALLVEVSNGLGAPWAGHRIHVVQDQADLADDKEIWFLFILLRHEVVLGRSEGLRS